MTPNLEQEGTIRCQGSQGLCWTPSEGSRKHSELEFRSWEGQGNGIRLRDVQNLLGMEVGLDFGDLLCYCYSNGREWECRTGGSDGISGLREELLIQLEGLWVCASEGSLWEGAFCRNGEASLSDRAHGDQAGSRQFCRKRKSKGVDTFLPAVIHSFIHPSRCCTCCSVYSYGVLYPVVPHCFLSTFPVPTVEAFQGLWC